MLMNLTLLLLIAAFVLTIVAMVRSNFKAPIDWAVLALVIVLALHLANWPK